MIDSSSPSDSPVRRRAEEVSLGALWVALRREWRIILGSVAALLLLAALITSLQRPLYRSETTLLIGEAEDPTGLGIMGNVPWLAGIGSRGGLQTDMVLLESRQVAEAVVDSLKLQVELLEPVVPRSEVVVISAAAAVLTQAVFRFDLTAADSYELTQEEGPPLSHPSQAALSEPFSIGGAELTLSAGGGVLGAPLERVRIAFHPYERTVREVQGQLEIALERPGSRVVNIGYRSHNPELAASVPNSVAAEFLTYKARSSNTETRRKIGFLEDQLAIHTAALGRAEERLRNFRQEQQIVEPTSQAAEQVRRFAELQAEREALITERDAVRRLLARIEASSSGEDGRSPYRQLVALPTFLSNRAVADILESLTQLENERAKLMVLRTENDFDVAGVDARISDLEQQLSNIARNYVDGIDHRLASTELALGRFETQIASVPAKEVEYSRLLREQRLLEEVYTQLQTSLKEEQVREAAGIGDITVIDPALIPRRPSSPKAMVNLGIGGILGLLFGVAAVLVRVSSNTRVRTRGDIEDTTPGVPVIGQIPHIRNPGAGSGTSGSAPRIARHRTAAESSGGPVHPHPGSAAAEAYRALRTVIARWREKRESKVFVLTSAAPGEGKTTTTVNLAAVLADHGERVLVIDGDLRDGALHDAFGVAAAPGLTEVLSSELSLEEALQEVRGEWPGVSLHLLRAGAAPTNPARELGSRAMCTLLESLRERYDVILIDTPALNWVTDAADLATHADGVVLIARAERTEMDGYSEAVRTLMELRLPICGVVLNDTAPPTGGSFLAFRGLRSTRNGAVPRAAS